MNWPGLLQWSLKQQTGYDSSQGVKPMDQDTAKWLREALESSKVDIVSQQG